MALRFRKKPVEIEAMQFVYPPTEIFMWWLGASAGSYSKARHPTANGEIEIKTLEDGVDGRVVHIATDGDWVIKGIQGEFYPCKPDIFNATYEVVK